MRRNLTALFILALLCAAAQAQPVILEPVMLYPETGMLPVASDKMLANDSLAKFWNSST